MKWLFIVSLLISDSVFANNALTEVNTILASKIAANTAKQQKKINVASIPKHSSNQIVARLKGRYQFVLFYRATCPHCQRFDPVLKAYAINNGIPVQAFTFDLSLPSFPNSTVVNKNVINVYFGNGADIAVPTLFIINTVNGHAYPVSSGDLSYQELSERMNQLAPRILRSEETKNA